MEKENVTIAVIDGPAGVVRLAVNRCWGTTTGVTVALSGIWESPEHLCYMVSCLLEDKRIKEGAHLVRVRSWVRPLVEPTDLDPEVPAVLNIEGTLLDGTEVRAYRDTVYY